MAAGRIKGITLEIGGDTTKLTTALKGVDSQLKTTQTALKDVNELLKVDPGNVDLLRQKQAALNDAVSQTKSRLDTLRDAQSQVAAGSSEWDALQREIIETEQNLQSLEGETVKFGSVAAQQVKAAGDKIQAVGSKIEGVGRKLSGLSAAAGAGLGAIGKLGYDAVRAADDLNTLSKQTGVSTDELQKWQYAADRVDVDVNAITGSMKRMKKGLESNSETFARLGVDTKDSSDNFRDATSIFYDTVAALAEIDNETERDVIAMQLFGKGADELAGIIDDGGKALKAYGEEAEQMGLIIGGDTLEKLNATNDTIDKLKATFGASFAEAGATIAETFAPALEKLAGLLSAVAERIRNLSPEQVKMITAILGIIAALGPVLVIVGKIVQVVGFVMSNISTISTILTALTGPIGLVVAAIMALTAAFVYFYNTNETFRDGVLAVWEQIKEGIAAFWEQLQVWFQQFLEWLQPVIDGFIAFGAAIMEYVQEIIAVIMGWLESHKAEIQAVMTAVTIIVKGAFDLIKGDVQTIFEIIKTIITSGLNIITNVVKAFTALLKGDWKGALNYLVQAASSYINMLKSVFQSMVDRIKAIFSGLINSMREWGRSMIEALIGGIKERIEGVKEAILGGIGKIGDFFNVGGESNGYSAFSAQSYSAMDRSMSANAVAMQSGPVVVNVALEGTADRIFRVVKAEATRNQMITGQAFA